MKKFLALVMAVAMMLSCTAFAEPILLADFGDPDELMVYNREQYKQYPVEDWAGDWVLVAAYVSEAFIEEFEYEDVTAGFYAVPENAIIMNVNPLYDASNTDPLGSGPIVDMANYYHCHTYDLEGTLTFAEQFGEAEPYTFANKWEEWIYTVRGEQDGDFNAGPCKTYFKGEDKDFLRWVDVTGLDFEDMEDMKYIGMNNNGQMVICSASKNIVTNEKADIFLAYIFEKVVPTEATAE